MQSEKIEMDDDSDQDKNNEREDEGRDLDRQVEIFDNESLI